MINKEKYPVLYRAYYGSLSDEQFKQLSELLEKKEVNHERMEVDFEAKRITFAYLEKVYELEQALELTKNIPFERIQ